MDMCERWWLWCVAKVYLSIYINQIPEDTCQSHSSEAELNLQHFLLVPEDLFIVYEAITTSSRQLCTAIITRGGSNFHVRCDIIDS